MNGQQVGSLVPGEKLEVVVNVRMGAGNIGWRHHLWEQQEIRESCRAGVASVEQVVMVGVSVRVHVTEWREAY